MFVIECQVGTLSLIISSIKSTENSNNVQQLITPVARVSHSILTRAVMVLIQDRKDRSFFLDQGLVLWVKVGLVLEWSLYLA